MSGQVEQPLALCLISPERGTTRMSSSSVRFSMQHGQSMLVLSRVPRSRPPPLGQEWRNRLFLHSVAKKRVDAVKALLHGGANLEVVNKWKHMCMSLAPMGPLGVLLTPAEELKNGNPRTGAAYKKLSLVYHPDKTAGMGAEQKEEPVAQNAKVYAAIFIELKNAYLTLSDNPTRRQYGTQAIAGIAL
eukprot:Skav236276  [mRNA]  locus=scaffold2289:158981:160300:+ [translate_table: standard]